MPTIENAFYKQIGTQAATKQTNHIETYVLLLVHKETHDDRMKPHWCGFYHQFFHISYFVHSFVFSS